MCVIVWLGDSFFTLVKTKFYFLSENLIFLFVCHTLMMRGILISRKNSAENYFKNSHWILAQLYFSLSEIEISLGETVFSPHNTKIRIIVNLYHENCFHFFTLTFFSLNKMFSKKKKKVDISAPSNFQHRVHTGFDNSSNKFVGLPKQWASLVEDTPASSSPNRPSPFIDPSIITPTDDVQV